MLDLFCGRWGWSRAFAARGWECVGVDLVEPPEVPAGCEFFKMDIFTLDSSLAFGLPPYYEALNFDFACASSPCEQFSVHGLRCFFPDPKYPDNGIRLFNHTRSILEGAGIPYVMENVRAAQKFVGRAAHHCGPFYLWGTGVPPLMNQGIKKGIQLGFDSEGKRILGPLRREWSTSPARREARAKVATIPPELANCVAEYAERICEASVK